FELDAVTVGAAVLASRISGAAYEACRDRMRVSSVKFSDRGSNCQASGSRVFHSSHTVQNTVMPTRKAGVPMNRAKASAPRPKVSGETVKLGSLRLLERGISKSS